MTKSKSGQKQTRGEGNTRTEVWWMLLAQGIVAIIVGALILAIPALSNLILLGIVGWYWLVVGILRVAGGADGESRSWPKLVIGGVGIAIGVTAVTYPLWSIVVVPAVILWMIGAYGIAEGAWSIYRAVRGKRWGMGTLGALSLALGILFVLTPTSPLTALTRAIGIAAVVGGVVGVVISLIQRGRQRKQGTASETDAQ